MRHYFVAAGIILAASLAHAGPATAADLEDSYDRSDRANSPYEDPRYAAIYGRRDQGRPLPRDAEPFQNYSRNDYTGRDRGRVDHSTHDHYADNRCKNPRRSGSYKDDDDYSRSNTDRRYSSTGRCLSKSVIRSNLRDDGWHAFELVKVRKNTGVIRARFRNGNQYRLRVDRCTGKILSSALLQRYRGDTYAYRNGRRQRTY